MGQDIAIYIYKKARCDWINLVGCGASRKSEPIFSPHINLGLPQFKGPDKTPPSFIFITVISDNNSD